MDGEAFAALLGDEGQALLASLRDYDPAGELAAATRLRRDHPAALVSAALGQARPGIGRHQGQRLRHRAAQRHAVERAAEGEPERAVLQAAEGMARHGQDGGAGHGVLLSLGGWAPAFRRAEMAAARGPQVGIPFVNVLPGIRFVFNVPMRIDRRFAALQAVEAVRMYASTHDGSPPPNPEALCESPMPLDPVTVTPFRYSVDWAIATLVAPPPVGLDPGRQLAVHYQIQVAH